MPARTPGNKLPLEHTNEEKHMGVVGNERLTALVSLVLLVLIIVELVTSAFLRVWLPTHTVVGVLLAGPLLVKMGSTGWRFLRYYTRAPAYVRRGPPPLVLRVLGPVLLITTLVMVSSGIGLVVTGPLQPFLLTHVFSALVWLPLIAVHSLGERVSRWTMSRAIKRLGWTRKKKSLGATERNEEACRAIGARIQPSSPPFP
jgi:hypothetical protein